MYRRHVGQGEQPSALANAETAAIAIVLGLVTDNPPSPQNRLRDSDKMRGADSRDNLLAVNGLRTVNQR